MTRDLTQGKPITIIAQFAVPMLMGMLFQQFYNLVDTMIVGKLLGAGALAAVGSTGAINFLVIGFCMGLCNGFGIPAAQMVGARDMPAMRSYVANAAYLSAGFAVVITTVVAVFCRGILQVMQTPEDIFQQAYVYILIIFLGIPATILYNLLAAIIRALGDSKTPVYFLAMSSVLNIGLDFALILWGQMGVAGAAAATVISQAISGLACLFYMRRKFPVLRMSREELRPDAQRCKQLCAVALPMGMQYSVTAIGSIILQAAVNTLGSLYVAAVAAGSKLFQLLGCPIDAVGSTMAIYSSQNVGAQKMDRLHSGLWASMAIGLGYSLLALGAMCLLAPQSAMLFLDPNEAQFQQLVELTSQYIIIQTLFFLPLAGVNNFRFAIQGMGFSTLAICSGLLEMVGRGAVALWLIPRFGYLAACFAAPIAWILADLFLVPMSSRCIQVLRERYGA